MMGFAKAGLVSSIEALHPNNNLCNKLKVFLISVMEFPRNLCISVMILFCCSNLNVVLNLETCNSTSFRYCLALSTLSTIRVTVGEEFGGLEEAEIAERVKDTIEVIC